MNELTKMQAQKAMLPTIILPNKSLLQRAHVPPIAHNVLRAPGQPLDTTTRAFMEPRFGRDFSQVRVHASTQAAESARAVNALAYTVGNDIAFAEGRYAADTTAGR